MKSEDFIEKGISQGDFYIHFVQPNGRRSFMVATLDFSTPYVAKISKRSTHLLTQDNACLVWSWTHNCVRKVHLDSVKAVTPLAAAMRGNS